MTETIDNASEAPEAPQGTQTSSREHRHRHHRHGSHGSRSHHRSTSRTWVLVLGIGAVVGGLVIIYLGSRVYALGRDNDELYRQLTDTQRQLESLQPQLARLKDNLQAAAQNRVPGLIPLEYDMVVPLEGEDRTARNVVFNRTGQPGDWNYEFKLVLENNSLYVVWPRIRLYLFDERGVQVGVAQVGDLAEVEQSQSLGPGEVRSVSGEMDITLAGDPAYFLVESVRKTDVLPAYESSAGLNRTTAPDSP